MHGLITSIGDAVITYLVIVVVALIISLVLTYAALRIRVITRDAVIPSVLIGSMILLGGPSSILPFVVFLGSSSALTKVGVERKEELGTAEDVKGEELEAGTGCWLGTKHPCVAGWRGLLRARYRHVSITLHGGRN